MKEAPFRQIPVPAASADTEAKAARERLKAELDKLIATDPAALVPKKKKKPTTN
jgi:hypothetical protein